MSRKKIAGRVAGAVVLTAAIFVSTAPASAQGFFDQLFGAPTPAPAPAYNVPSEGLFPQERLRRPYPLPHRKRKPAQVVDAKPTLQKPTDIMHDKTLRAGDAVMMKDGLRVYNGGDTEKHNRKQFVPLDDARRVSSKERAKLAALDVTRVDPLREGRSASEVVKGIQITDAHGNSIRYVGP